MAPAYISGNSFGNMTPPYGTAAGTRSLGASAIWARRGRFQALAATATRPIHVPFVRGVPNVFRTPRSGTCSGTCSNGDVLAFQPTQLHGTRGREDNLLEQAWRRRRPERPARPSRTISNTVSEPGSSRYEKRRVRSTTSKKKSSRRYPTRTLSVSTTRLRRQSFWTTCDILGRSCRQTSCT